jgi:holo-[acyl-carrier protein] synthase
LSRLPAITESVSIAMIYGIGTDIISVGRVERALARFGERFVERILSTNERRDYQRAPIAPRFLAKRFAAKEAFSKAIGTGIRRPVTWKYISIGHDRRGKPIIEPHPDLLSFMQARGIVASHVSISDEHDSAVAFVLLEGGGR